MDCWGDQNGKYFNEYWNTVSKAVGQILRNVCGARVSFEQVYSTVYKCVCDGFAEKMHFDLLVQCSRYLEEVDRCLDACKPTDCYEREEDSLRMVLAFHETLKLYLLAVEQITPIFAYLNKFYVELLLRTSLQTELLELFHQKVADKRMDCIMATVEELLNTPFTLAPAVVSALFSNLHRIGRGEYGRRYPSLFSRFVPGVLPPMKESDIETHIKEMKDLQLRLRSENEESEGHGVKRRGDDENYGPTCGVTVGLQAPPNQYS